VRRILPIIALLAGCDLFDRGPSVQEEIRDVQTEFRTVFATPAHIEAHPKKVGGEEVYDVTVKFDKTPPGYTPAEIRANANIVVRKHIRKVHDVDVLF
jgi:hypothetical protein